MVARVCKGGGRGCGLLTRGQRAGWEDREAVWVKLPCTPCATHSGVEQVGWMGANNMVWVARAALRAEAQTGVMGRSVIAGSCASARSCLHFHTQQSRDGTCGRAAVCMWRRGRLQMSAS